MEEFNTYESDSVDGGHHRLFNDFSVHFAKEDLRHGVACLCVFLDTFIDKRHYS